MLRHDFKLGKRYLVTKRGLINTGKVGRCTWVGKSHVELVMEHNDIRLKFNMQSLGAAEKPKAAKPAPKPEPKPNPPVNPADRKPLKKNKEKVEMVKKEVEVLAQREHGFFLYLKAGKYQVGAFNDFRLGDDRFTNKYSNEDILAEAFLGVLEGKIQVDAPKDIMEYPFWDITWGEFIEIDGVNVLDIEYGMKIFSTELEGKPIKINVQWINHTSLVKTEKVIKEVFPDGYVPDYEDQLLEKCAAIAKRARGNSFGVWYVLDDKIQNFHRDSAACHYAMQTCIDGAARNNAKILCGKQYMTKCYVEGNRAEVNQEWVMWVMNDSPWSQYIETKTWEDAVKYGVTVKLDIPANAMMCTFYALRYPTEFSDRIKRWKDGITKYGMHPTIAFYYTETQGFATDSRSHHGLLDTYSMDLESLLRFINHEKGGVVDKVWTDNYFRYRDVSIHHGKREINGETALVELTRMFKGTEHEENHPILGKRKVKVSATEQIVQCLMDKKKVK